MSIRYYPISKVKTNKKTNGTEFFLGENPYSGPYYETFDGKYFTGINPIVGKNQELEKIGRFTTPGEINTDRFSKSVRDKLMGQNKTVSNDQKPDINGSNVILATIPKFKGSPTSYFPIAIDEDYAKGYLNRYFIKKTNSQGYITEISEEEYIAVKNGHVPYDVTFWQAIEMPWKITGPLHSKRLSQYQTRNGIIETNQKLVENADKTFIGLKDYIGGKYDKFAKPTE